MRTEELTPVSDRAVIEITERGTDDQITGGGMVIVHGVTNKAWQPNLDFEIGTVVSMGEGDWEPVEVGDEVIIRAISGGVAGSDIGRYFGRPRGELVIVDIEEIVCKLER